MQMFIDDPEAIKKLMANQYKSPNVKTTDNNTSSTLISNNPASSISGIKNDNKSSRQFNSGFSSGLLIDTNLSKIKQENNNFSGNSSIGSQSHLLFNNSNNTSHDFV